MYIFAKINQKDFDGGEFANNLLEKGIAVAPGEGFGNYKNFIRISACQEEKILMEGMHILGNIMRDYIVKKLTVIGAGGQMGQWFTKYFSGPDYEVTGYDTESKSFGKNILVSESLVGCNFKSRLCCFMYTDKKELQK